MKHVNYRIWAHIIRFFLFAGICFQLLGFSASLVKDIFNLDTDFSLGNFDYGYKNYKNGYPVKTTMYLDIPDTVINYQNGTMSHDIKYGYRWRSVDTTKIIDTVVNKIKPESKYLVGEKTLKELGDAAVTDSTSNRISVQEKVIIRVKTKDTFHKWFYIVYDQLDKIFMVFIFVWLVKLINSYLKGTFLSPRSFNLIARIGYSFIWMNVISFIFRNINAHVLPDFDLVTTSIASGHLINNIKLSLVPSLSFDINYILIGVSILIISDIIKNAIFIKKEQDLTI